MTLVGDNIPNLIGGISQQPPKLRLASQSEHEVNTFPSIVEGLISRPHSHHVARLAAFGGSFTAAAARSAYVHTIDRDEAERYAVIFLNGGVRVFDLADGSEKGVNAPHGFGYLATATPISSIRATTNSDYTIIANSAVTAMKAAPTSTPRNPEGLVFIKLANYSTNYSVTLDGYTATVKTTSFGYAASNYAAAAGGNGTATDPVAISSEEIARLLVEDLLALHPSAANYQIHRIDSIIWIYRNNSADFVLSTADSRSDTQIAALKGITRRLTDLPVKGPNGFEIEIVGSPDTRYDNYYVRFQTADAAWEGEGYWTETYKKGESNAFDPATMPHALVRENDGTFTFKRLDWTARSVGALDITPDPSFVGATINDVYFVRNRLAFVSDEGTVMSRSDDYFNFFYETATAVLDTDPIDKVAQHKKVSVLNFVVPFGEETFFFSDKTQFRLEYGEVLSNETAEIVPKTEYDNSPKVQPAVGSKAVYFASQREGATVIFEFFRQTDGEFEAAEITAHVPTLIKGNIRRLAASKNENLVAVLTDADPRTVYVHHYFWAGNDKLQAAWAPLEFFAGAPASEIINVEFINSRLVILAAHADGLYLDTMIVSPNQRDTAADHVTALDRRVTEAQCVRTYDSALRQTAVTLPYYLTGSQMAVVARYPDDHTKRPGAVATIVSDDGVGTLFLQGDWSAAKFYVGEYFDASYVFSPQFIRKSGKDGGQEVIGTGRLQMRYYHIHYSRSGPFEVRVTPAARDTFTAKMTGRILGQEDAIIGSIPIASGRLSVPVFAKNDEVDIRIVARSHLPLHITAVSWEGTFYDRARQL